MQRLRHLVIGTVAFAALGTALIACGDSDNGNGTTSMNTPAASGQASSANSPAADLRVGLTALLQEHVYLAGTATGAALSGGDFQSAAATLDTNTVDLSKAVGSVYGAEAEKAFLELWRKHIVFFVDYTQGKAANDTAKVAKARADLDGYRGDFGAFIASANPNLTKEAVAEELKVHVDSLFAAIDAQATKNPMAFMLLRTAAGHMPHTAEILAGAIAKQMPSKYSGNINSGGAELRVGLTALLQEHVYLAGIATGAALSGGDFPSAAATLDANTVDLSKAIGSVYGVEAEKAFLELWRKHIVFFVDYTQGKAMKDDTKVAKARADLDGYRGDFGAFIASANPNLTKEAVAEELKMHVATLFAAIDSQASGNANAFTNLRTAASHMPHTAGVLADAIVKQMPTKFAIAQTEAAPKHH